MISCNRSVPTLQQMSLVVIAVKICNDLDIKDLMKKYGPVSFVIPSREMLIFLNKKPPESSSRKMYRLYIAEKKYILFADTSTYWASRNFSTLFDGFYFNFYGFAASELPSMKWEELVSRKITSLGLPNIMKNKLVPLIRCICLEINKWQIDHKDKFRFDFAEFQRYFCWNTQGKIDRIKTAKSLINEESLPIYERYNLARHYCFASDVFSLWEKMNSFEKQYSTYIDENDVQQVWFEYMTTKTDENSIRICNDAMGNPLNLRAFFSLLPPTEKVGWYISFLDLKVIDYEDLHACLSLLEKNDQECILRKYSSKILQYYLVWPLQNEFLNVMKNVWPYMSIENYIDVLHFIIYQRIGIGWKDFDYVWLLKEFWKQTPNNFKEFVKTHEIYQVVLPVINCEVYKRFPNEVILENYEWNILKFQHIGIKYEIRRKLVSTHTHMTYGRFPEFQNSVIVRAIIRLWRVVSRLLEMWLSF
ncbi:uncharacterized protein TNIN_398551 [Trichonephila inaurata madagascariensis]|uniref:Uncharacterized protein n=1 Tax=Trichonephila inaurata madagascariensis TaxID=2747483 RepID=A0A8X6M640_9ARAC|nr:uncharacterized protein TNIN_398551 [Trichonephila inaurata madagascariensis]